MTEKRKPGRPKGSKCNPEPKVCVYCADPKKKLMDRYYGDPLCEKHKAAEAKNLEEYVRSAPKKPTPKPTKDEARAAFDLLIAAGWTPSVFEEAYDAYHGTRTPKRHLDMIPLEQD